MFCRLPLALQLCFIDPIDKALARSIDFIVPIIYEVKCIGINNILEKVFHQFLCFLSVKTLRQILDTTPFEMIFKPECFNFFFSSHQLEKNGYDSQSVIFGI